MMLDNKVDHFLNDTIKWHEEFIKLRMIILDCELTEELKWGVPCYTFEGRNVVLIHGFKNYCALLFFKGVLLNDHNNILIQQTENVQASRQIRFISLGEIVEMESILKSYIKEAIEIEKAGLEFSFKKNNEFTIPEELEIQFKNNVALKKSFEALTPGRQRAYFIYFSAPKQSKTRVARVGKYINKIISGKGLYD